MRSSRNDRAGIDAATYPGERKLRQAQQADPPGEFLAEMDQVVPWRDLCVIVEPFYPRVGNGRPPIGLEGMLRLHFLQH
jgi:hypothetical protein